MVIPDFQKLDKWDNTVLSGRTEHIIEGIQAVFLFFLKMFPDIRPKF